MFILSFIGIKLLSGNSKCYIILSIYSHIRSCDKNPQILGGWKYEYHQFWLKKSVHNLHLKNATDAMSSRPYCGTQL